MLCIRNLSVFKDEQAICQVEAIDVSSEERVAIVGCNGTGKTTLLRVVAGLERSFSGEIETKLSVGERVYVHQSPLMFRGSVMSNVTYGLREGHGSPAEQRRVAQTWLDRLESGHLASRRATQLSAGERRRVALARAFVLAPPLLLLDEPFSDLDEHGIELVCQALSSLPSAVLIASPVPPPASLSMREFAMVLRTDESPYRSSRG